jgi:hypothetical protein
MSQPLAQDHRVCMMTFKSSKRRSPISPDVRIRRHPQTVAGARSVLAVSPVPFARRDHGVIQLVS